MNKDQECKLKIDQFLHGYDSGHRQLSSSLRLDGRDKQTLLQLSDRSVEAKDLSKRGYLTGYPLKNESVYILARTWPAPEMKRPGCVWTHSLAISFTGLAQIQDVSSLLKLFRRPEDPNDFRNFDEQLKLELKSSCPNLDIETKLAEKLLHCLYSSPDGPVVIQSKSTHSLEQTVCAVWGQQWPRLRRNFKFCTLATRDRSTQNIKFDLQIKPNADSSFSNEPISSEIASRYELGRGEWLGTCLRDLSAFEHPLRNFLRRAASDITGGRDRFAELCVLYDLLLDQNGDTSSEKLLNYITNRLPEGEGMLLRKEVLNTVFKRVDRLSNKNLLSLLPHFDTYGSYLDKKSRKELAFRLWEIDPSILLDERTSIAIREELDFILQRLSFDELRRAVSGNQSLIERTIPLRRDVMSLAEFWKDDTFIGNFDSLFLGLSSYEKASVLSAIIDANRTDLFHQLMPFFEIQLIFDTALKRRFNSSVESLIELILKDAKDPEGVIVNQMRRATKKISKKVLNIFARHSKSNRFSAPIENDDPWANAWLNSSGKLPSADTDFMHVFLLQRALRLKKDQAVSLLAIAFDPLRKSIRNETLSYENKWKLSEILESADWFDWSYDSRLMRTIGNYVLKNDLTEKQFNLISESQTSNSDLVRVLRNSWGGRDFLRKSHIGS